MIHNQTPLPQLFKGIALFTPGGDLIYGIDSSKQAHWHIHLCLGLQQILGLSEPPHFLVPGYTATIDRWLEARTQKIRTSAQIYPAVQRYQSLLRVLFQTNEVVWQTVPWQEEYCNSLMLETYRHQFPQLWEDHNLIIRLDPDNNYQTGNFPIIRTTDSSPRLSQQTLKANFLAESKNNENGLKKLVENRSEISISGTHSTINQEINKLSDSSEIKNSGYVLRLFISSDNAAVERTLTKIHQLLEEGLVYPYTLKVIDISKNPEQAENYHISATPTLVRVWPQPIRRIVGKLDDFERVLQIISSL
ncbi:MAG: circadian clock KaiB family protein [Xenococcaceae cyanobacterium MO_188.B29]|nr:circadian clock KaiB family protein [Xenococcaceae cyanobacterium MO_188.B29]